MKIVTSKNDLRTLLGHERARGHRIGFVPTMGYLHEGHASLMRLARQHSDIVVVSIFVNPTQFGPNEDLSRYPRDLPRDEAVCRRERVDYIFYPPVEEMYPPDSSIWVVEDRLSKGLCGASRPGHFRGVCTVVAKLFHIVQPDLAVFGAKDAQQLRVIQRMVRDLDFPIEIMAGPIYREADGLAMSSRNVYLDAEERRQALSLSRALHAAEELYRAGERRAAILIRTIRDIISAEPLLRIDYIELVDDETLEPVTAIERPVLVALAVYAGKTRLIDNHTLA